MTNLWGTLVPLAAASAAVPVQIVVTIVLLRAEGGRSKAIAWIGGMTAVRLVQGLLFGVVLSASDQTSTDGDSTSPIVAMVLLVVAVLLYITAARSALSDDDPDAPPPKWMARASTLTPGNALVMGVVYLLIAPKFWVFTLSAVGAISDAELGVSSAVLTFLLFVVLAEVVHFVLLGMTMASPERAGAVLARASAWLEEHNRVIMIVLGLIFGTWFMLKALDGLGVI
jgi:threonine/homoserine/homoserine lactone efflux protein